MNSDPNPWGDEPVCVHIVDDDEAIRRSLQLLLSTEGIPAITYPSAEVFLEKASWTVAGCLILDLRMPGMGGERLLSLLHEKGDLPPIIVLTAHGNISSAVRTIQQGAVEFLEKPCPGEILIAKVKEAIQTDVQRLRRRKSRQFLLDRLATLTARETDIIGGVMEGLSTVQIAERFGLQPKSVELYRSNILSKLEFASSIEMVRVLTLAFPDRWTDVPPAEISDSL